MSAGAEDERFELLSAVGEAAGAALPLDETVARLLDLVVPLFADVATLDAISQNGELRRLGSRVQGSGGASELEGALLRRRPVPGAPVGLARALETAESQLLQIVTDEDLRAIAADEEDLELMRALELRSALFVPLRARGRTVGGLACGVGTSGRRYGEGDLRFAEVLSGRLALALDNAGLSAVVRGLEHRLEATLTNLAEAVIVREVGGTVAFVNAAAARLLGFESPEQMTGADPEELMSFYDVFDEEGRRVSLADLPSAAAARGERPAPLLVRNVISGVEHWLLHKATPVFDPDGSPSLVVSVIEDLTEVKRAELAQRLLAEAGHELSSSLDYGETLQRVAQLAIGGLADWCGVLMRSEGDVLEAIAVAHADPGLAARAREVVERHPVRLGDPTGLAATIRSGRPRLIAETGPALSTGMTATEQAALAGELGMHSVIVAPLAVGGRPPLGALLLAMGASGRRFDEGAVELAGELARRAATAVENARLYAERSRIAATLQRSLLPPELPEIPGFRLAGLYRAAGEQNDVGGDFYDAFEVPGGWMVAVGDVAGRGAEAAALTSLSRYTLRTAARLLGRPIPALEQLNAALQERPGLSLVSVCAVVLREAGGGRAAEADVVLAGHPAALCVRGGVVERVGVFAPVLGAYEGGGWSAVTVALEPGDQLILYTDGVIDTVGESDRFGEQRLAAALRDAGGAADAVRRIDQALTRFARGSQSDDTAVIAVERVAVADAEPVVAPDVEPVVEQAGDSAVSAPGAGDPVAGRPPVPAPAE